MKYYAALFIVFAGSVHGSDIKHSIRSIPELDSIKAMAAAINKSAYPIPGAYCESYTVTQVNSCSGEKRSDSRSVLKSDGSVTSFSYRAWNEDGQAVLGEFRGTFPAVQWKSLLDSISALRWVEEPGLPDPSIPPSPTQTIKVLTLCDGNRTTSFSISGPSPMMIESVMNIPNILAESALDTVWALRLETSKVAIRKGKLQFKGTWKSWGKSSLSLVWPEITNDPHSCGQALFEWSGNDGAIDGRFTENSIRVKNRSHFWKVNPGQSTSFELQFPYSKKMHGPKTGKLREFGILVKPSGSNEAIPVTFFSDRIRFDR